MELIFFKGAKGQGRIDLKIRFSDVKACWKERLCKWSMNWDSSDWKVGQFFHFWTEFSNFCKFFRRDWSPVCDLSGTPLVPPMINFQLTKERLHLESDSMTSSVTLSDIWAATARFKSLRQQNKELIVAIRRSRFAFWDENPYLTLFMTCVPACSTTHDCTNSGSR